MREILFRGKSSVTGEWVCGNYMRTIIGGKEVDVIVPICGFVDLTINQKIYQIDPETLGQWTGLTDRNGKKIFEGDVVKYGDTVHLIVFEQKNNTAYYGLVYSPVETLPFGYYQDLSRIEIVGNIHDNPELLKEEKQ